MSSIRRDVHDVVASDESISICPPLDPVDVLFRLLESNVHVAINGLELSLVDDTRVKLDGHGVAMQLGEETRRVPSVTLGRSSVLHVCQWLSYDFVRGQIVVCRLVAGCPSDIGRLRR